MDWLAPYETMLRLGAFASVFVLMATLESALPRKQAVLSKSKRWFTNLSLVIVDSLALRLLMPILAIGMAELAAAYQWGLFNQLNWPVWMEVILAFVLLDLLIYAQHIAFHKIPLFWRIHKVHHADRDLDVTSGARFHPLESLLSMAYKLLCILLLGPAAIAVFLFELVLNAASMFNHANVRLPLAGDRILRLFIVTPDMHRVHHSIIHRETDSNYGFFLSVWDRIFRTYIAQPRHGHQDMVIGLAEYQDEFPAQLGWSLLLPFRRPIDGQKKTGELR